MHCEACLCCTAILHHTVLYKAICLFIALFKYSNICLLFYNLFFFFNSYYFFYIIFFYLTLQQATQYTTPIFFFYSFFFLRYFLRRLLLLPFLHFYFFFLVELYCKSPSIQRQKWVSDIENISTCIFGEIRVAKLSLSKAYLPYSKLYFSLSLKLILFLFFLLAQLV
jgi:hypothetical protein